MHVALLTNTAWLDEELRMFRHLGVGLIDEQVRVAQVVPDLLGEHEINKFGDVVTWRDSRWPFLRRRRLLRVADELEKLGVDLVHALDGRLWRAAAELSLELDVPAVLQAFSVLDLKEVEHLRRRHMLGRVGFAATTEPLRKAIAERLTAEVPVRTAPLGVYVGEAPAEAPASAGGAQVEGTKGDLCAIVSGTGEMDEDYAALLRAMAEVVRQHPGVQFFFDGQRSDQHGLWQAVRQHRLLENVSLVPRRLGHREMLLRGDVLIQPQALGKARSLTLAAMGQALPVIAKADPWVDYLVEGQTAWLVGEAAAPVWLERMLRAIERPGEARELGAKARRWVAERHTPSRQVAATLTLYRQMTGESLAFTPGS
ncbi:MAG: glycosyltransferase family 4 protein [Phycisphaeraceae bacterium]|nr:glycosyltransferase family 4 protein [Phycisphaeraceae bacterium]